MSNKKRKEDQLRSEIYKHYHDNNISNANRLIGTFQEFAPAQIMQKKPLGLTPGVSDFIFFGDYAIGFLEVKFPRSVHNLKHVKRQAELMIWYQNNIKSDVRGYFITTVKSTLFCIDCCNGFHDIQGIPEGFETANKVYSRILELERQGKKTIKF